MQRVSTLLRVWNSVGAAGVEAGTRVAVRLVGAGAVGVDALHALDVAGLGGDTVGRAAEIHGGGRGGG